MHGAVNLINELLIMGHGCGNVVVEGMFAVGDTFSLIISWLEIEMGKVALRFIFCINYSHLL